MCALQLDTTATQAAPPGLHTPAFPHPNPTCLGDLAQRQAFIHQVPNVLMLRRPLLALHSAVRRLQMRGHRQALS